MRGVAELLEVTHRGHSGRRTHRPHTQELLSHRGLWVNPEVSGDALIAPGQVRVELDPLRLGALQRQTSDASEFVAGIFQHGGQGLGVCAAERLAG